MTGDCSPARYVLPELGDAQQRVCKPCASAMLEADDELRAAEELKASKRAASAAWRKKTASAFKKKVGSAAGAMKRGSLIAAGTMMGEEQAMAMGIDVAEMQKARFAAAVLSGDAADDEAKLKGEAEMAENAVAGAMAILGGGGGGGGGGKAATEAEADDEDDGPDVAQAEDWSADSEHVACQICEKPFNAVLRRRHHCRRCGACVCASCSPARQVLKKIHPTKLQRVCKPCAEWQADGEASSCAVCDSGFNRVSRPRHHCRKCGKCARQPDSAEPFCVGC